MGDAAEVSKIISDKIQIASEPLDGQTDIPLHLKRHEVSWLCDALLITGTRG